MQEIMLDSDEHNMIIEDSDAEDRSWDDDDFVNENGSALPAVGNIKKIVDDAFVSYNDRDKFLVPNDLKKNYFRYTDSTTVGGKPVVCNMYDLFKHLVLHPPTEYRKPLLLLHNLDKHKKEPKKRAPEKKIKKRKA
jgi:hypothetical protein